MDSPTPNRSYLSRSEAAEYIGVSPYALRNWASAGRGPAYARLGGRVVYRRDMLDQWITEHMVSTLDQAVA